MLTIDVAEDLFSLRKRLIERLSEERPKGLLRSYSPIVTPRKEISDYVRFGVAAETGIAAGLSFVALQSFVLGTGAAIKGGPVLTKARIECYVLAVLADPASAADPALALVHRWIATGKTARGRALREFQFAEEMGRLFEEYSLSRPDRLSAWENHERITDPDEAMQAALWRRVRAIAPGKVPTILERAALSPASTGAVHFFGFTTMATGFQDALVRAAAYADVHVYAVLPHGGPENVFAAWWKAEREFVGRLGRLGPAAPIVHPLREIPAAPTRLDVLRATIAGRPQASAAPPTADDKSFRVFACAGPRREAEVIVDDIWNAMVTAPPERPLDFEDIVILCPKPAFAAYARHFLAAMEENRNLPCTLREVEDGRGRFAEAVRMLFDLSDGAFDRGSVTAFLRHPVVGRRFPELDAELTDAWVDAVGILRGIDARDLAGTYVEKDIWNWDQGLRRLADAAFTADDRRRGDPAAPPTVSTNDLSAVGTLSMVVRSLATDIRGLARSDEKRPLADWFDVFARRIRAYLATDGPYAEVARALFDSLAFRASEDDVRAPLSYATAVLSLNAALDESAGAFFGRPTGGVRLAALGTIDGIPFRRVYVAGLGEGVFPQAKRTDAFDLRPRSARECDVHGKDLDLLAFAAATLAAKDALILSYVGRDAVTGETIEPSTVVRDALAAAGVPDGRTVLVRHPLRRFDPAYFDPAVTELPSPFSPGAAREHHASLVRAALPPAPDDERRFPLDDLRARLSPASAALFATPLALHAVPPETADDRRDERRVTISQIAAYLKAPLEAAMRFHLGLRDDESIDVSGDEPLEPGGLETSMSLRRTLTTALEGGGFSSAAYDSATAAYECIARWPTGPFGSAARTTDLRRIDVWKSQLEEAAPRLADCRPNVFGTADESSATKRLRDALRLEIADAHGPVKADVTGSTGPFTESGDVTVIGKKGKVGDADLLRAFVEHAVLAAAGHSTATSVTVIGLAADQAKARTTTFDALTRDEATRWLNTVVGDLFSHENDHYLTFEMIKFIRTNGMSPRDAADRALADAERRDYGGALRAENRYRIPKAAEVRAVIERRYALFFERMESGS